MEWRRRRRRRKLILMWARVPYMEVYQGSTLLENEILTISLQLWQKFLANSWQPQLMAPANLFIWQCTNSHSAGISHATHELCMVFGPNLHCIVTTDSMLANSKTLCFPIACPCHDSSQLPSSIKTWNYAMTPITQKRAWRDSLHINMLISGVCFGCRTTVFDNSPCTRCGSDVHPHSFRWNS